MIVFRLDSSPVDVSSSNRTITVMLCFRPSTNLFGDHGAMYSGDLVLLDSTLTCSHSTTSSFDSSKITLTDFGTDLLKTNVIEVRLLNFQTD